MKKITTALALVATFATCAAVLDGNPATVSVRQGRSYTLHCC